MIEDKLLVEIDKTMSEAAFGYTVMTNATYSKHVRPLMAERKELIAANQKLNDLVNQYQLLCTEKDQQIESLRKIIADTETHEEDKEIQANERDLKN